MVRRRHNVLFDVATIVRAARHTDRILACAGLAAGRASSLLRCCNSATFRRVTVTEPVDIDKMRRAECVPGGEEVSKYTAEDNGNDDVAVEGHGDKHDEVL